jgi:STE24 endopeptidase
MAFDPAAATAQYIDGLGAPALAKAAAYTTGGHWLLLWGLLVTALVTWVFVRSGLLVKIEQRLQGRGPFLRAFLVCACFLLLSSLLTLPWSLYTDWWRETTYARTSQPLADYLGQAAISLGLSTVIGALFLAGVYALIRRTGKRWWLWSGGLVAVGGALLMLLVPMFVQPLFNQYSPLPPGEVREALVKMADEAHIPADRIFVYDGSRQSNNFTANAGGIGSAARIAISDVALKGASLDEVKAVTGHEIGHYVLGHTWRGVAFMTVMAVLFFFLADRLFAHFARAFGASGGIGEPTTLPVLLFIVSVLSLLAQPVSSTMSRWGETEADQYSLRTVNLPDALASALVKTAEYRNPRPSALEEVLFYDHPSVEGRVRMAMDWKAAHPAAE